MSEIEFRTYDNLVDEVAKVGVPALEARQFVSEAIWNGDGKIKDKLTGVVFPVARWRNNSPSVVLSSEWSVFDGGGRPSVSFGAGLRDAIISNPNFLFERISVLRYIEFYYRQFLDGRGFDSASQSTTEEKTGELARGLSLPEPSAGDDDTLSPEDGKETRGRPPFEGLDEAEEDLLDFLKDDPASRKLLRTQTAMAVWMEEWFVRHDSEAPGRTTVMKAAKRVLGRFEKWNERQERTSRLGNMKAGKGAK